MASAREYDINLIAGNGPPPGVISSLVGWLLIGIGGAAVLLALAWVMLHYQVGRLAVEASAAAGRVEVVQKEVDAFSSVDLSLQELGRQAVVADKVLQSVPAWNRLLNQLEKLALPEVTIKSLAADRLGTMRLTGEAPTLSTAMDQIAIWQAEKLFSKVTVSGLTKATESGATMHYSFTATLDLSPQALYGR